MTRRERYQAGPTGYIHAQVDTPISKLETIAHLSPPSFLMCPFVSGVTDARQTSCKHPWSLLFYLGRLS